MTARPLREAHVDLAAITHNVRMLRRAIGTAHFMAVVKANGFGHGAVESARAAVAGGADWLGVLDIPEALQLRAAGIRAPILTWMHAPGQDFAQAVAAGIDIGVSTLEQVHALGRTTSGHLPHAEVPRMQIKVDTGLSRNGAVPEQWEAVFAAAADYERRGAVTVTGIFSHLANAGAQADAAQLDAFNRARNLAESLGLHPPLTHLAATAAALERPETRFDLVRVGLGIYGLLPFEDDAIRETELGQSLRPALQLSAAIVSVKRVPAGSGVSYGHVFHTQRDSTLALVPLGYGDGVPRHASGRGPVSINGKTYCVAGRVAMDQIIVDLGEDTAEVGDRAVLFGDPSTGVPCADDWARSADTINYEIVTRLGGRIERTYSGGQ
ncbi:MAG: alanine racemase [Terrimesophilobacter sp.]